MHGYNRMKRVTDPLDDKVKARIIGRDQQELGYLSSGSEHSAHENDYSPSFSDLVFGLPDDVAENAAYQESDSDSDGDDAIDAMYESTNVMDDLSKPVFYSDLDLFRNMLVSNVTRAMELFSCLKWNKPMLRRNVMTYLIRDCAYNAAICKTKWDSSGGLTAGNYEFIDVIRLDSSNRITRYFVDLDFAAEFELARPTKHYEHLLQQLPKFFVGKGEELKQILKLMSDAGRRSLKSKDLHIPPWRKHRFMQNKWLGAYKRTTNVLPSTNSTVLLSPSDAVKCQSIGFNAAVNGRLIFPATTY